jgi:hypothetical protein
MSALVVLKAPPPPVPPSVPARHDPPPGQTRPLREFSAVEGEESVRPRFESRGVARQYTESAREDERYRRVEDEARRPAPVDLGAYQRMVASERGGPGDWLSMPCDRLSISSDQD